MTPTGLDILLVTLFTWSLKVRFTSSVTPRNLTVETLVMIVSRISMSNAFFWLEIIIYDFTNVQRKSVGLEPVIKRVTHVLQHSSVLHTCCNILACCTRVEAFKRVIYGFN